MLSCMGFCSSSISYPYTSPQDVAPSSLPPDVPEGVLRLTEYRSIQDAAYGFPSRPLLDSRVNKGKEKGRGY